MTGTKTSPEGQERNQVIWIGKTQTDPYWELCANRLDIVSYENVYDAVADILLQGPVRGCVINAVAFGAELRVLIQTILSKELTRSILIYNCLNSRDRDDFSVAGDLRVRKIQTPAELSEFILRLSEKDNVSVKTDQPAEREADLDLPIPEARASQGSAPVSPGELLAPKVPDASPVEEKPSVEPWPMEPPVAERPDVAESLLREDRDEVRVSGAPHPELHPEISSKIEKENTEDGVETGELDDALNLDKLTLNNDRKKISLDAEDTAVGEGNFHLAQLTSEELDALLGFETDKKMKEHK